jgi:hypothetical protein
VPLEGERARRLITAILQNVGNWEERLEEIASHATPGNRVRSLSLLRDMEMFKLSLCRLARMEGEAVYETPADKPPDE